MEHDSRALVEAVKSLNAKLFSLPRLQLLSELNLLGDEYALYRDLKASLMLDDGVLIFNLRALVGMGYVAKREVTLGGKKMDAYKITADGAQAFEKIRRWLAAFANRGGVVLDD
ncbi:MAG: transcriptional regulator [Candidatus Micrarchaeota archaeon]